jgi:hypothetical protein
MNEIVNWFDKSWPVFPKYRKYRSSPVFFAYREKKTLDMSKLKSGGSSEYFWCISHLRLRPNNIKLWVFIMKMQSEYIYY